MKSTIIVVLHPQNFSLANMSPYHAELEKSLINVYISQNCTHTTMLNLTLSFPRRNCHMAGKKPIAHKNNNYC